MYYLHRLMVDEVICAALDNRASSMQVMRLQFKYIYGFNIRMYKRGKSGESVPWIQPIIHTYIVHIFMWFKTQMGFWHGRENERVWITQINRSQPFANQTNQQIFQIKIDHLINSSLNLNFLSMNSFRTSPKQKNPYFPLKWPKEKYIIPPFKLI